MKTQNSPDWEELKAMDEDTFNQYFIDTESCLKFLAERKWENGFICRKCGHTNYCKGKTPYARRCTRCKTEESATAHTMFHRCRIHLPEAFSILKTVCSQPRTSSSKLSEQLEIRLMTCWRFKKKVMECLQGGISFTLINPVQIHTPANKSQKK